MRVFHEAKFEDKPRRIPCRMPIRLSRLHFWPIPKVAGLFFSCTRLQQLPWWQYHTYKHYTFNRHSLTQVPPAAAVVCGTILVEALGGCRRGHCGRRTARAATRTRIHMQKSKKKKEEKLEKGREEGIGEELEVRKQGE